MGFYYLSLSRFQSVSPAFGCLPVLVLRSPLLSISKSASSVYTALRVCVPSLSLPWRSLRHTKTVLITLSDSCLSKPEAGRKGKNKRARSQHLTVVKTQEKGTTVLERYWETEILKWHNSDFCWLVLFSKTHSFSTCVSRVYISLSSSETPLPF